MAVVGRAGVGDARREDLRVLLKEGRREPLDGGEDLVIFKHVLLARHQVQVAGDGAEDASGLAGQLGAQLAEEVLARPLDEAARLLEPARHDLLDGRLDEGIRHGEDAAR